MILLFILLVGECQSVTQPCILVAYPRESWVEGHETCEPSDEDRNMWDVQEKGTKIVFADSKVAYSTVIEFVKAFKVRNESGTYCSEMIGVVGDLDVNTASIIHSLANRANLNFTLVSAVAPSTFQPTTHLVLPNLLHMNPLTHYINALAAFLDHLNWTRVGLISDNTPYFEFATELIRKRLLNNPNRSIVPFVRVRDATNKAKAIHTFKELETDVVVVSASGKTACSLMQTAQNAEFTWPKYAWIILDVGARLDHCPNLGGGVIIFREQEIHRNGECRDQYFLNLSTYILHNNTHFHDLAHFQDNKRLIDVSIAQRNKSNEHELAVYSAELQQLNISSSFAMEDMPRGKILRVKLSSLFDVKLQVTLVMSLASCLFVLVTTSLILYVCFRKEPEIKATSVTVSLSMFLGCYILIIYLPLLVVDLANSAYCNSLIWVSIAGISLPWIAATLFVKLLRLYWIFSNPFSYKKKLLSDAFLMLYIILLVSPTLLILVLWSSLDPFVLKRLEIDQGTHILLHTTCRSYHSKEWLAALLIYYFILNLGVSFLAFKTARINAYQIFKDTNSTNAFAFLSSLIGVLTLVYWSFFRSEGVTVSAVLGTRNVVYVGNSLLTILCQILLFIPKVYPPLRRKLAHIICAKRNKKNSVRNHKQLFSSVRYKDYSKLSHSTLIHSLT